MCGIVGLISEQIPPDELSRLLAKMSDSIEHRGPDGAGAWAGPGVAIGMRRLAIVDVEHGKQPMFSRDGAIVLVFNGEIYNAPQLRRELEREGVQFATRSDTEVILRLYERDPDDVENRLVGMWAFAIVDLHRKRVVLSRDRFGIKPLFVVSDGSNVAFASELFALEVLRRRGMLESQFRVDASAAHAMLAWSYVPGERTIYSGVERLAPGTRREIDLRTRAVRDHRYYQLAPSTQAEGVRSMHDAADLIDTLFARSIREHLESDVPIATLLSGGVDSSLVTAYTSDAYGDGPEAFTIGFVEPRFDESRHAEFVSHSLGLSHKIERLDEAAMRETVADAFLAFDEPFGDSSSIAVYRLSQLVAKTHKVALGGDGGDEVFAGYRKHRIVGLRRRFDAVPQLRNALAATLDVLPDTLDRSHAWSSTLRTLNRVARGLNGDDAQAYVALTQVASLAHAAPLAAWPAQSTEWVDALERKFSESSGRALRRTLISDIANTLPNDMLTKVDRASMASGLEVRVPFLDHRLVEAGLGLPESYTLDRIGKAVLRELCARRYGRRFATREKQGFSVPVEVWLQGPLARVCDEMFSTERLRAQGLLDPAALGGGRWRNWARNNGQLVWHALALAVWFEANHGGGAARVREAFDASASRPNARPQAEPRATGDSP